MKLTLTVFLFVFQLAVYCQSNEQDLLPREEIHVVSNHDLYLTGENIFLNISCEVDQGSEISKFIYVELIDEDNLSRIKKALELNNGQYNGSVFLPSNLKTGNYAIIAYTQWSRNFSPTNFGQKLVGIINPFEPIPHGLFKKEVPSKNLEAKNSNQVQITIGKKAYSPNDSIQIGLTPDDGMNPEEVILSISKEDERSKQRFNHPLSSETTRERMPMHTPEPKGQLLRGNVKNDEGQPQSVVLSLSNELMNKIQFSSSDENGEFIFTINENHRRNNLTLKAEENIVFEIFDPYIETHQWKIPALVVDSTLTDWVLKRAKEVQIDDEYFNERYTSISQKDTLGILDYLQSKTYYLDDYTRFPRIEDPILEYIPEIKMRTKRGTKIFSVANLPFSSSDTTLILFNGVPLSSKSLFAQNPNYIESITVYPKNVTINGFEFEGVIQFKTYKKYNRNVRFYNSETIDLSETVYEQRTTSDNLPDFRNQLLWKNINLKTDLTQWVNGSMSKGKYIIQLLDKDGTELGSAQFRIW